MKESFQSKAYRDRSIKNPANICFCAPAAQSASGISAEAMRRCAPPSTGRPALTAVCRPAASGSAMTDAESWGRCPACGLCSEVPGSHTLCRSVMPGAVFSVFRPDLSEYQRHPIIPRPAPFHFPKLRSRSRTAACRFRRQGRGLSPLFLYIHGRHHLRRLFRVRTNHRQMHGSIRSGLKVRHRRTDVKKFSPMSRLPATSQAGHGQRIRDSAAPRPGQNTTSPHLSESIEWCIDL